MTIAPMSHPARAFSRRVTERRSVDPALLVAAGLFIAVLIAEAAFIALSASSLPADIGSLYAVVP